MVSIAHRVKDSFRRPGFGEVCPRQSNTSHPRLVGGWSELMKYQYEVKSIRAFVQRVACEVANRGYVFYVTGYIPEGCVPEDTDRKLLEGYGLCLSKFQRYRRKSRGLASVQYVRHGRFFVMFATPGEGAWFEREQ